MAESGKIRYKSYDTLLLAQSDTTLDNRMICLIDNVMHRKVDGDIFPIGTFIGASFPVIGDVNTLYIDSTTRAFYSWSGTAYVAYPYISSTATDPQQIASDIILKGRVTLEDLVSFQAGVAFAESVTFSEEVSFISPALFRSKVSILGAATEFLDSGSVDRGSIAASAVNKEGAITPLEIEATNDLLLNPVGKTVVNADVTIASTKKLTTSEIVPIGTVSSWDLVAGVTIYDELIVSLTPTGFCNISGLIALDPAWTAGSGGQFVYSLGDTFNLGLTKTIKGVVPYNSASTAGFTDYEISYDGTDTRFKFPNLTIPTVITLFGFGGNHVS